MILVIVVLVVIGTALIGLIWGVRSALLGAMCLAAGAVLISTLWLLLTMIQKWIED